MTRYRHVAIALFCALAFALGQEGVAVAAPPSSAGAVVDYGEVANGIASSSQLYELSSDGRLRINSSTDFTSRAATAVRGIARTLNVAAAAGAIEVTDDLQIRETSFGEIWAEAFARATITASNGCLALNDAYLDEVGLHIVATSVCTDDEARQAAQQAALSDDPVYDTTQTALDAAEGVANPVIGTNSTVDSAVATAASAWGCLLAIAGGVLFIAGLVVLGGPVGIVAWIIVFLSGGLAWLGIVQNCTGVLAVNAPGPWVARSGSTTAYPPPPFFFRDPCYQTFLGRYLKYYSYTKWRC